MRYLGLDYGTKTVGLAISDRTGFLASNHGVIRYQTKEEIFTELERIVSEEKIEAFVLGYPKNMNNTCGKRVEETLVLKQELEEKIIRLVDTTKETFKTEMFERSSIGTISEIYDSTEPYEERGAFAQAWSVAEVFRIVLNKR